MAATRSMGRRALDARRPFEATSGQDGAAMRLALLVGHLRERVVCTGFRSALQCIEAPGDCRVDLIDCFVDELGAVADRLAGEGRIDALLCTPGTASYLRSRVDVPVHALQSHPQDLLPLLAALPTGREPAAARVGALLHRCASHEEVLQQQFGHLTMTWIAYDDLASLSRGVNTLKSQGCDLVLGSSAAVELAQRHGCTGELLYGRAALSSAIDAAGRSPGPHRPGRGDVTGEMLDQVRHGVLIVDGAGRVLGGNSAAARLVGVDAEGLAGREIGELVPELRDRSGTTVDIELSQRVRLRGLECLVQWRPRGGGRGRHGSVLTIHDASTVRQLALSLNPERPARSPDARYVIDDLCGASPAMQAARDLANRYARSGSTVLIVGESGTGKEIVAQGIHRAGGRRDHPFIALNCAAFPEPLLESELFGYDQGAFTGGRKGGKPGLFEAADRGTVFLDEIGEMPLPLQTRLLRVLQERRVTRLGSTQSQPIDVRVVAATHCDLPQAIREGRFRADLYYRLNVARLRLPALRERLSDLPMLVHALCQRAAERLGISAPDGAAINDLMPMLWQHPWPGNVRELENLLERWMLACADTAVPDRAAMQQLLPELFEHGMHGAGGGALMREQRRHLERATIEQVLAQCDGNQRLAAERLGVSYSTLWRRLRRN